MNSPLNEILIWFQSLDQEIQKEFFDLFYIFHYDKNISG